LIDKGVEKGILFVAPAGNLKSEKDLRFPASYPPVISVGGVDEQLHPYPNLEITKKAFVCAPAVNILTTVPDNKHNFLSGTSLSSAYITGLLALAFEDGAGLNKQTLPTYKGNLCKWVEDLLQISICEK
jgi:subtilisin family serine protease